MSLEEILEKEKKNVGYIFLYREDGAWYAYELSAFYCYSLWGIPDIDLLASSVEPLACRVVRLRVTEPDKFLRTHLLLLQQRQKTECTISCKIACGGFQYWREQLRGNFR